MFGRKKKEEPQPISRPVTNTEVPEQEYVHKGRPMQQVKEPQPIRQEEAPLPKEIADFNEETKIWSEVAYLTEPQRDQVIVTLLSMILKKLDEM